MKTMTIRQALSEQALGAWTPDQLYVFLKGALPGFEGLNTSEFREPETGALQGEIRLSFSDAAILPAEKDILDILAGEPPPPPPRPPTLDDKLAALLIDNEALRTRLAKLEMDVLGLKGGPVR